MPGGWHAPAGRGPLAGQSGCRIRYRLWNIPARIVRHAALAYTSDGTTLAAGTTNGNVYLYSTTSYQLQGKLTAAGSKAVTALAYAPGGVILAVGYASGATALWDADTGKATAHLSV